MNLEVKNTDHGRRAEQASLLGVLARRADTLLLVAAICVAAVLRFPGLGKNSLWTDELYMVWESRQPLALIFDPHLHIQHPPGYRLAQHIWMGLGLSEAWIRLLPAICGVALVAVVWALARALWPGSRFAGAAAALLTATSSFLMHYSRDATAYSWSTLWLSISFLLLIYAWRSDKYLLWTAWALSLAVSLYSHYFNFFPLAVQGVGVIVIGCAEGRKSRRRLAHALLAIIGATALYSPWLWALGTTGAVSIYLFPLTVDAQVFHWLPTLLAGLPNAGFWQSRPVMGALWFVIMLAVGWAVWRFSRTYQRGPAARLALVAGWGLSAAVGPYLFLRITTPPGDTDPVRFATMSAPALLLALSRLLAVLPAQVRASLALAWLVTAGVQVQDEFQSGAALDWRYMIANVASGAREHDAFLAFPAFHAGAAAMYYPQPLTVEGGWFTRQGTNLEEAAYWFPPGWKWRGFLDTEAHVSNDWSREIAARTTRADRLWYLAGDGLDGTYPTSKAAEVALGSLGWRPVQEWRSSPLVLRLYAKPVGSARSAR